MLNPTATPRPSLVTFALGAAWLDWLIVVSATVGTTSRPELLGLALPTLGTQALLILGLGWGSNVARMSFYIWSIFGAILSATGGEIGSDGSAFAELARHLSNGLTVITLVGLLLPAANAWFLAQRTVNKMATASNKLLRAKRNLKVAAAWLMVLPVSALIAIPLNTHFLAVFFSCIVATCVGTVLALREGFKLYRLRSVTTA